MSLDQSSRDISRFFSCHEVARYHKQDCRLSAVSDDHKKHAAA